MDCEDDRAHSLRFFVSTAFVRLFVNVNSFVLIFLISKCSVILSFLVFAFALRFSDVTPSLIRLLHDIIFSSIGICDYIIFSTQLRGKKACCPSHIVLVPATTQRFLMTVEN